MDILPIMTRFTRVSSPLVLLALIAVAGCSKGDPLAGGPSDRPMGRGGPPPTEVLVATGQLRPFGIVIEAVGTALARESVDITAKVGNTITAIRFQEGQRVAAGDLLAKISAGEVNARLLQARSQLNAARRDLAVGRGKEAPRTRSGPRHA